jgi:hypothetical protein
VVWILQQIEKGDRSVCPHEFGEYRFAPTCIFAQLVDRVVA